MEQRPLIYEVPHKAIRYALSQFSLCAGNTNYNEKSEMEKLNNVAGDIFAMLKSHAEHENSVP